jgi:2-polyprenyl-3-methyl-5-hydroxy-6-metoxy-1,4-benzoquinol methylase
MQPHDLDERWLDENSSLRLDATVEWFPGSRRTFHLDRYRFAAERCTGMKVLDAACGTGYGTELLGQVASEVIGVDLFEDAIDYARRHHAGANVSFRQAPVELLPFPDGSFDRVASFETLEHTLSPEATVAELARVTRADGCVLVSTPNLWGETPNHFADFDARSLGSLLDESFARHELYYQNSGDWKNRSPAGIGPLGDIPAERAECFLAVCHGPRPRAGQDHEARVASSLSAIYAAALEEHRERLRLHKRCHPLRRLQKAWRRRRGLL